MTDWLLKRERIEIWGKEMENDEKLHMINVHYDDIT